MITHTHPVASNLPMVVRQLQINEHTFVHAYTYTHAYLHVHSAFMCIINVHYKKAYGTIFRDCTQLD